MASRANRGGTVRSALIYACFAALSIPFIVFLVKETKGKALEQMG